MHMVHNTAGPITKRSITLNFKQHPTKVIVSFRGHGTGEVRWNKNII